MEVAVVGHVEWIEFVRVERVPTQGEIVHALDAWGEAAGGGGVAAVQLARLAGSSTLFTAIGDDELGSMDGVYFVSGDAAAVRAARAARVLVATARSRAALAESRIELDALVRSRSDEGEAYRPGDLDPPPRMDVATAGALGGTYTVAGGAHRHYQATAIPGALQDSYGAGDSFAAGLTYGLA